MSNTPYLDLKLNPTEHLLVTVRNRERVFYQGPAKAVTSYNAKGKFDILLSHTNFISIINTGIIIYKMDDTTQEYKISTGVLKVSSNIVDIYLGILTAK